MNNKGKCIYYVEGPCEQQLIAALKEFPSKLLPGKVKVYNVIQNLIPKSQLLSIQAGTTVVLAFDTDVEQTVTLRKNLELLDKYCAKLHIVYLPQVLNLEDELVRCTDVKSAAALTQSSGIRNFKTDFCKLKVRECRAMLERHSLQVDRLWTTPMPETFLFIKSNGNEIKL